MEESAITLVIEPLCFGEVPLKASFVFVSDILKYAGTTTPVPVYTKEMHSVEGLQSARSVPCASRICEGDKGKVVEVIEVPDDKQVIPVA